MDDREVSQSQSGSKLAMANDGGQSERLRQPIEATPQSEQVQELVK